MPRTVKEWVGKTDDAAPSEACKRRILDRQHHKCAITGKPFTAKEKPQFDHITPLWLDGKNCESNLQAIHGEPHKRKTSAEATVRAKVNANISKNLGLKAPPARPLKGRAFPKSPKPPKQSRHAPLRPRQLFREVTP